MRRAPTEASLAMPPGGRASFAGAAVQTPFEKRLRLLNAPSTDVRRGVPPGDARDLDYVACVRRVDEGAAANVNADVPEPVEEDEVARLEVAARDGAAHPVLRVRAVRKRHPDLREDVHPATGAVDAGG